MSDLNSSFMTLHRQEQRLCAVLSDVDTKSLPLSLPRVLSIVDRHRVRPMHGHRKSGRGTSCLTLTSSGRARRRTALAQRSELPGTGWTW